MPGGFRPIADYALLADCNGAALVSRAGSVDWLCLPRYDAPSLFARLLDPTAGHWWIRPLAPHTVQRRYLPGTLVLETTFTTADGQAQLLDAMAFARGQRGHDLGLAAPHELLRLVTGVHGQVAFTVELAPRPGYAAVAPTLTLNADALRWADGAVRAGHPLALDDGRAEGRFAVAAGQQVGSALRLGVTPTAPADVGIVLADTVAAWRSWETAHDRYRGRHRGAVRLSARVLKGLSYRPSGAVVAAATTSLPEAVGGARNWDYRFAWVRDASLALQALYIGACPEEAGAFLRFLARAAGDGQGTLQIMFGVGGEHELPERELPHLRGWRDSRPVRVGNDAYRQTQLDVYGHLLDALHRFRENLGELDPELQRFAVGLADEAAGRWREPDQGMWEMRGPAQHHVSSKLMCWVALDRAVDLAGRLGAYAKPETWAAERAAIRSAILAQGWSARRGAFAQAFESDELDAAALLMPLVGFLPATDPRMRATIDAVAHELTEDGLVLRYHSVDGLEGGEGTFLLCSFWLAACWARTGERTAAERLFAQVAGYANDLGLLAEEVDATAGELLGNFPQAFSHIGLITTAWELDHPTTEREAAVPHRILLIANRTCECPAIHDHVEALAKEHGQHEVLVAAPALNKRLAHYVSDTDGAVRAARERVDAAVSELQSRDVVVAGEVGDADPWAAIQDALVNFRADEVVIATFPPGKSHWLERRLITTAQAGLAPLPVTHLISEYGIDEP